MPGLSETYLRLCIIQILKMANITHTLITLHNLQIEADIFRGCEQCKYPSAWILQKLS